MTVRILICFSRTGGGHIYAARAIEKALHEVRHTQCNPDDVYIAVESVIGKSNPINRLFVRLYNYLLQKHQPWMKYYFAFIECFKPNNSELNYQLSKKHLFSLLALHRPQIVVSVHPMINHYMTRAMKDAGLWPQTKYLVVVTDPNAGLWSGWACESSCLTICPNDIAAERLVQLGLPADKIEIIGMPVDLAFSRPAIESKAELFARLGLAPGIPTILLSGGWAGGGAMPHIYSQLQKVSQPIQVIALCGRNKKQVVVMVAQSKLSKIPTAVLGFVDSLSDLMDACDLLVTKAGGLTTFEAVARRLPLALDLLTEPMPQEAGTVAMLIEAKLALPLEKVGDIVNIANGLKVLSDRQKIPLPNEHNLDRVQAAREIAERIFALNK